jgi:hypothetical protein
MALAAPAGAAKPPKTVEGTYSGTLQIQWTDCHWAGTGQGLANGWEWSGILNHVTVDVSTRTLGKGTMEWRDDIFDHGDPGPWTFTAQAGNDKHTLSGTATGWFPPVNNGIGFDVSVSGGTGKFAHATGGALTVSPYPTHAVCDGLNFASLPGHTDPSQPWPAGVSMDSPVTTYPTGGSLTGNLTYAQ